MLHSFFFKLPLAGVLILVLPSLASSQSTGTKVYLSDTINTASKIFFTGKRVIDTITIDGTDSPTEIIRLQPSNFFWNKQFKNEDYYTVDYGIVNTDKSITIISRNHPQDSFQTKALDLNNDFVLEFIPVDGDASDTLSIRNKIMMRKKLLSFFPQQMQTGAIPIHDTVLRFQIWPFQTGPTVRILNEASAIGYDRYEMTEKFVFDSLVISFSEYNFTQRTISVQVEDFTPATILHGYKVGRTVIDWGQENSIWDSLNIQADQPLILYFGASWCAPCLQELPRLQNIASVCSNYNVSIVSAAALHQDSREEALAYLSRNEFPGTFYIASLYDPKSLNKALNISTYPTYVFISKKGEILFRAESKGERDRTLNSFFSQFITQLKSN